MIFEQLSSNGLLWCLLTESQHFLYRRRPRHTVHFLRMSVFILLLQAGRWSVRQFQVKWPYGHTKAGPRWLLSLTHSLSRSYSLSLSFSLPLSLTLIIASLSLASTLTRSRLTWQQTMSRLLLWWHHYRRQARFQKRTGSYSRSCTTSPPVSLSLSRSLSSSLSLADLLI